MNVVNVPPVRHHKIIKIGSREKLIEVVAESRVRPISPYTPVARSPTQLLRSKNKICNISNVNDPFEKHND